MIRRSPCEAYIRFLLVHPRKHTDEAIKSLLIDQQLDFVSLAYIKKLRAELVPPSPFYPKDRYHDASQEFLLRLGVRELFFETSETKGAWSILNTPRVKEFVESMTLSGAPLTSIVVGIKQQLGKAYSLKTMQTYLRFFWDLSKVDSSEVRALISRRFELCAESGDPDITRQAKAVKQASWLDPRRAAANLPQTPISAMLAQVRMGFSPSTSDLNHLVSQTRAVAVLRAYEATVYGGPDSSSAALNYAIAAEKMGNILEQIVAPDEDLRDKLQAISLRTNPQGSVPLLKNLSQGQHTIDIQPLPETVGSGEADVDE